MTTTAPVDIGTLIMSAPDVYGGRPCLAGTRFPVLEIAVHYNAGMSPEAMVKAFEGLDLARVYAGIAYYLANRAAIDAELEEEAREYEATLAASIADREQASV